MQVSVESTGTLKREMKVAIPEEQIRAEVQKRLQSLSQRTKVDGFRPGKVPFKVIEIKYGRQVRLEVVGDVVQSSFYEAVGKQNLRPAGRPLIDPLNAEQGDGLSYTATFEVMPEISLEEVSKLEIRKPVCEITDDDYRKMSEVLRRQRQTFEEADRESEIGDTLEIDFDGEIDGEAFDGGASRDFKLELGQGRFIDGFEPGLTGTKAGDEVTLDLKFPDDYGDEKLAGKPVRFKVKINKVLKPVLPGLDEKFFLEFGIKEGGEEAFKKEVVEHMRREADVAVRNRQRDVVMDALYAANTIELPESLVHEEAHRLKHQFEDRLKSYGVDSKANPALASNISMFEEQAKKRVALQLIVMEIIRKHEIKADPARVRTLVETTAGNYHDPGAVIKWYYSDKQRLAEVEAQVLEDEVVNWICDNARITSVHLTFDELMNKGQTDESQ